MHPVLNIDKWLKAMNGVLTISLSWKPISDLQLPYVTEGTLFFLCLFVFELGAVHDRRPDGRTDR